MSRGKTHFKNIEEEFGAICGWVKEDKMKFPFFKVSLG